MTHGIVEILVENTAIQDLVGRNAANDTWKVYPVIVPQGEEPPYICARVMGVTPWECKGQQIEQEEDLIQVDFYAKSYEATYQLYRVARAVLDHMTFTVTDGTEMRIRFTNAKDYSEAEMGELAKRGMYAIMSVFTAEVTLGDPT